MALGSIDPVSGIDHSPTARWLLHQDALDRILAPMQVILYCLLFIVGLAAIIVVVKSASPWIKKIFRPARPELRGIKMSQEDRLKEIYEDLQQIGQIKEELASLTASIRTLAHAVEKQGTQIDEAVASVQIIIRETAEREAKVTASMKQESDRVENAVRQLGRLLERLPTYGNT